MCNHPGLLSEKPRPRGAEGAITGGGIRVDEEDDGSDTDVEERLLAQADIASLIAASGKLIVLVEILRHLVCSVETRLLLVETRLLLCCARQISVLIFYELRSVKPRRNGATTAAVCRRLL